MGGAGKKLPGGGARRKANTPRLTAALGDGPLPHPRRLVSGQRFMPRRCGRRRTFTVTRVDRDGVVAAVKEDGGRERITLRAERLLSVSEDGSGTHYRFVGFRAGRRIQTFAYVAGCCDGRLVLILPEWHPARPVRYPQRLMPEGRLGAWLTVSADLGQAHAAALNLADLRLGVDPGADRCHRPRLSSVAEPRRA